MNMRLVQLSRTCTHCGALNDAVAPFSNFDRVTNESCEYPAYDLVQTSECLNCHQTDYLYWHNSELERNHIQEMKELLYFKSKLTSDIFFANFIDHVLQKYEYSDNLRVEEVTAKVMKKELPAETKKSLEAFDTWHKAVIEFAVMRTKRKFSDEEVERFTTEMQSDFKTFNDEFFDWFKESYPDADRTINETVAQIRKTSELKQLG